MARLYLLLSVQIVRKFAHRIANFVYPRLFGRPRAFPWMLFEEVDVIRDLLVTLRPERCLEWGAGYSTVFFPKFLSPGAQWLTIEHDVDWAASISRLAKHPAVNVVHVPAKPTMGINTGIRQDDFKQYVDYPSKFAKYDFILVDGRDREDCLNKGHAILASGGVIVLHDANRPRYAPALSAYRYRFMLRGRAHDQLGIWVGSATIRIETVLDVGSHRKIWAFYVKMARSGSLNLYRRWQKSISYPFFARRRRLDG
jgi:predicted O-methyltransferase YrrM